METILFLLLSFAIACGTLWLLWKFWGKTGIIAFGIISSIFACLYSGMDLELFEGVTCFTTMITFVPFLAGAVFMVEKFGSKSAISYMVIAIISLVAIKLFSQFLVLAVIGTSEFDFWSFLQPILVNALAVAVGVILAILLSKLFNGKIKSFILRVFVVLAILVLADAIIYVGILSFSTEVAFGEALMQILNNFWQKLILAVFAAGVLLLCDKTKTKEE